MRGLTTIDTVNHLKVDFVVTIVGFVQWNNGSCSVTNYSESTIRTFQPGSLL